jgi:hypothetical protein
MLARISSRASVTQSLMNSSPSSYPPVVAFRSWRPLAPARFGTGFGSTADSRRPMGREKSVSRSLCVLPLGSAYRSLARSAIGLGADPDVGVDDILGCHQKFPLHLPPETQSRVRGCEYCLAHMDGRGFTRTTIVRGLPARAYPPDRGANDLRARKSRCLVIRSSMHGRPGPSPVWGIMSVPPDPT